MKIKFYYKLFFLPNLSSIKYKISIIFFVFFYLTNSSQTIIKGNVKDIETNIVGHGVILLKEIDTNIIKAYKAIDKNGNYKIEYSSSENDLFLEVIALGYKKNILLLDEIKQNQINIHNFILTSESLQLNEVIVDSSPIKIKKDTIIYTASKFIQGNEENVEDLLRKIPGVFVDKDGKIKYGKQEIEKVLIDYEDLFDKGYKLLTKTMPVKPIEKIEVLKNYTNNTLLKDIEKTNKVALNLKLNDEYKRLWFGNIKSNTSVASENSFYNLTGNLMNFAKKNKHYLLANFNNTGFETIGDVAELMSSTEFEGYLDDEDNQKRLLEIKKPITFFSGERTNFNDSELISSSSIFNFSEETKLKTVLFVNTDENFFSKNILNEVNTELINFSNREDSKIVSNKRNFLGKLELTSKLSPFKENVTIRSAFKKGFLENASSILFNDSNNIDEDLNNEDKLFDLDVQYTNKINKKTALVLKLNYHTEKVSQVYNINRQIYDNIFSNTQDIDSLKQFSNIETVLYHFNANFLVRKSNNHYFKFNLGNKYKIDKLQTELELLKNNLSIKPEGFNNNLNLVLNELYLENSYTLKYDTFEVDTNINIYLLNSLFRLINEEENVNNFIFVNPKIDFNWNINKRNILNFSFLFSTQKTEIADIYSNSINTSFRNFSNGTGSFNLLNASRASLTYEFGNPYDKFTTLSNLSIVKQHDYFSTNTIINQNYYQTNKVLFKDRVNIDFYNHIEYYFRLISSNLRLGVEYSESNYQNILNNSLVREINTESYKYNIELRSAFKSNVFNYHIGTSITNTDVKTFIRNSYKTYNSFFNIYFSPIKRIDVGINSLHYYLSSNISNSNTFFLDFDIKYSLFKDKINLGLVGKNIFNNKSYEEITITDNFFSTLNYNLLPRYVLLKLDYKF